MFTKFFRNRALKLVNSRQPDFVVGEPDDPYMLRWWWIPRNKWFNVYVHMFLKDDDDRAMHDHPWASLSLLCEGVLKEYYKDQTTGFNYWKYISPGEWSYRSSKLAHRLEVPKQPFDPITIFITGPRIREWGFHCPMGWKHWKDFVGMTNQGSIGAGCGETDLPESKIVHDFRGKSLNVDRQYNLPILLVILSPLILSSLVFFAI